MGTADLTRRLSAILSADVEGYSRLMRDDDEATVQMITTYRTALAHLIQQYRGRVVDSPGDNILAEFTSVVDAVNCGVELQRELAERNAELPENRRMQFRIGINLGDILQERDRIYGDGVNIAARIESLAEAGGICISGTVYDSIEGRLGLEFENLGEHEVKNIDKPIRVYRILSFPGAAAHRVVKAKKAVGKTWRNAIIAVAAVLVVGGALAVWHFYFRPPPIEPASVEKMAFKLPEKPSIAVLPFVNMSGDREQEYIADGITENIITALSKIPEMFVISRTSTMTYKGKPVKAKQVAEELGVQYVLEGSIQRSGDRLRVTAQLIDAIEGHHLWAERYDQELKDIFALQDEITVGIVSALDVKLRLGGDEAVPYLGRGTKNLQAYIKYIEAYRYFQRSTPDDYVLARKLSEEAIASDPEYPAAYYVLAWTHIVDAWLGTSKSPSESIEKAFKLGQKVLAMDELDARAHLILGNVYWFKKEPEKAIAELKRGLVLDPNNAMGYVFLGHYLSLTGRPQEGIPLLKKSMRLNPLSQNHASKCLYRLGVAYQRMGQYEEALLALKKAANIRPNAWFIQLDLAYIYIYLGREEEARAAAAEIRRIAPTFSLEHYAKTGAVKEQGFKRKIEALRKAGIPEKPPGTVPEKPSIAVLPFANISGDPKEDYLSDGITEQIITALSKIPRMLVIARNSVFTYKGKPVMVQQVSEELGVRYVLEGSVQKEGDRLRITAQLIDAKTGNHLWSERYDRDLKDLFELQDDITKNVIMALQIRLTQGEVALIGKGTKNLEAYLKAIKGLHHHFRDNKNDNEMARRFHREAIELDPNYASAYVNLGWSYFREAQFGWTKTPGKSCEKAVEMAKKALSLDDQHFGAYLLFANVYAKTGQFEKALSAGKKGLSLNPANSTANALYGLVLYYTGRFKEAIPFFEKAIRIDPKPQSWYLWMLGWAYFGVGQNEKAITVFNKYVSRKPSNAVAHCYLGAALNAAGKPEEAVEMFEKASSLNPDSQVRFAYGFAIARVGTGHPEEAVTKLREVLSSHPDSAEAYRGFSTVLTFEGKYEEALSMVKKSISLRSGSEASPYYYWSLGVPYLLIGEYEKAIAAFKKAISVSPENIYGNIGLTAAYSLAGRMEEARTQATEVLKINPKITLEDIAKNGNYSFQKADKERFINALRKAGLK